MNTLVALWQTPVGAWGVADWLILIIILAAACGITYLACEYFGVKIPPIFLRILLIVVVAAVAIVAIRFLFSL